MEFHPHIRIHPNVLQVLRLFEAFYGPVTDPPTPPCPVCGEEVLGWKAFSDGRVRYEHEEGDFCIGGKRVKRRD